MSAGIRRRLRAQGQIIDATDVNCTARRQPSSGPKLIVASDPALALASVRVDVDVSAPVATNSSSSSTATSAFYGRQICEDSGTRKILLALAVCMLATMSIATWVIAWLSRPKDLNHEFFERLLGRLAQSFVRKFRTYRRHFAECCPLSALRRTDSFTTIYSRRSDKNAANKRISVLQIDELLRETYDVNMHYSTLRKHAEEKEGDSCVRQEHAICEHSLPTSPAPVRPPSKRLPAASSRPSARQSNKPVPSPRVTKPAIVSIRPDLVPERSTSPLCLDELPEPPRISVQEIKELNEAFNKGPLGKLTTRTTGSSSGSPCSSKTVKCDPPAGRTSAQRRSPSPDSDDAISVRTTASTLKGSTLDRPLARQAVNMLADMDDAGRPVPITNRGVVARPENPRISPPRASINASPPTGVTLRVDKAAHKDKLRLSDANLKEMLRILRQQNEEKKQATANRLTPAQRRQLAMRRPGERTEFEERPRSLGGMYASSNPSSTGF